MIGGGFLFAEHVNYVVFALLMTVGLFVVMVSRSRVKQMIGLSIFQTSVLLFYISLGYVSGSRIPILTTDVGAIYSNPLSSVLMLTAIVVGIATMAVGLAMIIRIEKAS